MATVTAKQAINNLLDTIPEFQLREVVDFVAFIKKRNESPGDKDLADKNLARASLSSMDFWDNAIDDEVWNDV
jgi:hypothetical protein